MTSLKCIRTPSPSPGSVARPSRNLPLTRVRNAAGETTPSHCMFGVISFNGGSSFVPPSIINVGGCAAPRMATSTQRFRLTVFEWKLFISTIHDLNLATTQNLEYSQPISTTMRGQVVPMGPHLSTGQAVSVGADWTSSSHWDTPFDCANSFVGPHLSTGQLVPMGAHFSTAQAVPTRSDWTSSCHGATPFECANSFVGATPFD
jgi:hypothetical protein